MTTRNANGRKLAIPRRMFPTHQLDQERQSLAERHKFRTLSLLGQTIKIKATEFLPGIHNPGAETALDYIAAGIEIACANLELEVQTWALPGVTPIVGIAPSSMDFLGAGTVVVGTLATFADKLSTLLARSVIFRDGGRSILLDDERSIRLIKTDASLRGEWERFMLHGAGIFFNGESEKSSLTRYQDAVKNQLMSAIEVFGLAREYGLYFAQHMQSGDPAGRHFHNIEPDLLADEVAWTVGQYLGKRCFAGTFSDERNTWMESGAGAVALLSAVRAIRSTRDVVETGTHNDEVRVSYVTRLKALENWNRFDDDQCKQRFRHQR